MEKEIWKPIKGYETYYEVSNYGNVRSVDRVIINSDGVKRLLNGKIMKIRKNTKGYLVCNLYKNSKLKSFTVHRLVAQAFIPNPNNLPQINHKDENKASNFVSNLEWCTCQYNIRYGTGIQRSAENRKMLSTKPVVQLDINTGRVIYEYPSMAEAERQLNICHSNISNCCLGKRKTAGGYKWQYKE